MRILLLIKDFFETAIVLDQLTDEEKKMICGVIIAEGGVGFKKISPWKMLHRLITKSGIYYTFYCLISPLLNYVSALKRKHHHQTYFKSFQIPILRAVSLDNPQTQNFVENIAPDLILSIYFDRFVPEQICAMAKQGAFNLHPSLLPSYRGANPNFWVILNQDNECGTTLHHISSQLDSGDIAFQKKVATSMTDSVIQLDFKLAKEGGILIHQLIAAAIDKTPIASIPQNQALASIGGIPERQFVKQLRNKGRKLFTFSYLLSLLKAP